MTNKLDFIDLNSFTLIEKISSGKHGIVYTVEEKETGQIYAAKITKDPLNANNQTLLLNLKREVNLISQLVHPSILKFIGYSPIDFDSNSNPVIITEYSKNGSLSHILQLERDKSSPDLWDDTQKLINLYGIASAMSYLHSNNILHRDLKPENILENDSLCPLIADFGLSKVSQNKYNSVQSMIGIKGTPYYISPEVFATNENTTKSDVYAFAMIVYEMITLEKPFNNFDGGYFKFMEIIAAGERPIFTVEVPNRYKQLITDCWDQNADKRPTFPEIVTQLKTDKSFITPTIDEERYHDYINSIENSERSFDPDKNFQQITLDTKINEPAEIITLNVKIYEAKNLLRMNFGDSNFPYVTLHLKDQPLKKPLRTKTIKNTLNPVWNEEFYFIGIKSTDSLLINMFDEGLNISYKMMTEMQVPVSEATEKRQVEIEYKGYKKAGSLFFALSSTLTKHGYIKIHVFDARDLVKTGLIPLGRPDPSLDFQIKNLPKLKAKTTVKLQESDPVWNEDFVIDVPDINCNSLIVALLDGEKVVHKREIVLAVVPVAKIQIFNGKIFDKKKEIGTLHYGFELCAGYPKQPKKEKKVYVYHEYIK